LQSIGLQIELHPFDVSRALPRITRAERERRPTYRINLIMANADQMARLTSLYATGFFDDAYNIAVWAWELAAFRSDWHGSFAAVDEVWTNSDFEVESIGAVAPVPVHKIRLPVEVASANAAEGRDLFGIPRRFRRRQHGRPQEPASGRRCVPRGVCARRERVSRH
jgi:hypothetical protein